MAKVFVENVEITITEKSKVDSGEHIIKNDDYIMRSVTTTEYKSSIYSYSKFEKILISKVNRFNEGYIRVVLFNDNLAKAWTIIELSEKLEIKVQRVREDGFIVIGNSKDDTSVTSQVSFCKLKPSTKVEEIVINFTRLNEVFYLSKNKVVISYEDIDPDGKTCKTLAIYNYDGKLLCCRNDDRLADINELETDEEP